MSNKIDFISARAESICKGKGRVHGDFYFQYSTKSPKNRNGVMNVYMSPAIAKAADLRENDMVDCGFHPKTGKVVVARITDKNQRHSLLRYTPNNKRLRFSFTPSEEFVKRLFPNGETIYEPSKVQPNHEFILI